jgi:hypothetical protein
VVKCRHHEQARTDVDYGIDCVEEHVDAVGHGKSSGIRLLIESERTTPRNTVRDGG